MDAIFINRQFKKNRSEGNLSVFYHFCELHFADISCRKQRTTVGQTFKMARDFGKV